MKQIFLLLSILGLLMILSCKSKTDGSILKTVENVNSMSTELNAKFNESTKFHSIMFSFDEILGNTILVKIGGNADSSKMQEWFFINGLWEMTSEKILDVDSLAFADHFFSTKVDYSLSRLKDVIEIAAEKAEAEKDLNTYKFNSINLSMGNQAFKSNKMENLITQITIESLKDQKRYLVNFKSDGSFISINEE